MALPTKIVLEIVTPEQRVLGCLIENVVDDLNCIHQAGAQSLETILGFPAIDAEAEVTRRGGDVVFALGAHPDDIECTCAGTSSSRQRSRR